MRLPWDSPEVQELIRKCKTFEVRERLKKNVGKQEPMRFLGQLLEMVGVELISPRRPQGNEARIYTIDREKFDSEERRAIGACLDLRFEKYLSGDRLVPDFTTLFQTDNKKPETAETRYGTGKKQHPRVPIDVYSIGSPGCNSDEIDPPNSSEGDNLSLASTDFVPGTRVRVNVGVGFRPHGKEGTVEGATVRNESTWYLVRLEVDDNEAWLREYAAKPEWLEKLTA